MDLESQRIIYGSNAAFNGTKFYLKGLYSEGWINNNDYKFSDEKE